MTNENRSPLLPKKLKKKSFDIREYLLVTAIIFWFYLPFSTLQLFLGSEITLKQYITWLWQDLIIDFATSYPLFIILTKIEPKIKRLIYGTLF